MATKKDFTAKNLHEYVDSYLKSYYEVEDKDAAADANMETQDVKTGDASKEKTEASPEQTKLLNSLIKADIAHKKIIAVLTDFFGIEEEAAEKVYKSYKKD